MNSVHSVRDKTSQRFACISSHTVGAFYFSQKNTEEQNTQHSTETLSQPISQNVTATESLTSAPLRMEGGWLGTEVEVAGGEAYEAVPRRTGQLGDEEVVDSEPFLLK